jgi:hypothetical protein
MASSYAARRLRQWLSHYRASWQAKHVGIFASQPGQLERVTSRHGIAAGLPASLGFWKDPDIDEERSQVLKEGVFKGPVTLREGHGRLQTEQGQSN